MQLSSVNVNHERQNPIQPIVIVHFIQIINDVTHLTITITFIQALNTEIQVITCRQTTDTNKTMYFNKRVNMYGHFLEQLFRIGFAKNIIKRSKTCLHRIK